MIKMVMLLLFLMMMSVSTTNIQTNDDRCDVCMEVITDLDAWITSDKNMDEIVQYVQGVNIDINLYHQEIVNATDMQWTGLY